MRKVSGATCTGLVAGIGKVVHGCSFWDRAVACRRSRCATRDATRRSLAWRGTSCRRTPHEGGSHRRAVAVVLFSSWQQGRHRGRSTRSSGPWRAPTTPTSCSRPSPPRSASRFPTTAPCGSASTRRRCSRSRPPAWSTSTRATANTFWHGEFHEHDANLFGDLAREPVPAATLRTATERPSAAQRPLPRLPPAAGLRRRAAGRVPDRRQHVGRRRVVPRARAAPRSTRQDVALFTAISSVVGVGDPHAGSRRPRHRRGLSHAPGLLLFDRDGVDRLGQRRRHPLAERDLRRRRRGRLGRDAGRSDARPTSKPRSRSSRCSPAPAPSPPAASRARPGFGCAIGPAAGSSSTRRCSTVPAASGNVAVVVEPAKSADIAPIIIEAYGLTPRERDVVRAIARGSSTPEIASRAVPVRPHRARLHQVGVREGRRQQPGRARRQALRRALRRPVPRDARPPELTRVAPTAGAAASPRGLSPPPVPRASGAASPQEFHLRTPPVNSSRTSAASVGA